MGYAEADVLDQLNYDAALLAAYEAGKDYPSSMNDISPEIANLGTYIETLFSQHNQTTQYLTYANQLWKLESYLSNKLGSDYNATASSNEKMNSTIYVARQRYMDKAATVFYRSWIAMVLRQTLFCIIFTAVLVALYSADMLTYPVLVFLLVLLFVWYFFWFYHQIDLNSRRDHTDPSIFIDWVNPNDQSMSEPRACLIYQ